MTETVLSLCLPLSAALFMGMQTLYYVHMLQLNSYRPERYDNWCRQNRRHLLAPRHLCGLLTPAALLLPRPVFLYVAAIALYLLGAALNFPKKAKKPLVVTARVRRLFTTLWLFLLLLCYAIWFFARFSAVALVVSLAVLSVLPFGYTALANTLNAPLEKAIADRYVRDAARRMAERPDLTVIGITGSYGKTSTKTCLKALLSVRYNVLMTPESYNTTMGVVRTIRERLHPSHQIFLAEMGAKQPGDIAEICHLVHPTYGVLTSIGEQHLETFGSLDAIIRTKFELIDALPDNGTAFLNADNEILRERAADLSVTTVTYGTESGDYRATDLTFDRTGCRFTVTAPDGECATFATKLLGAHNIQNLTGCIAVAHTLGIPLKELIYPVRLLRPVPHRLELLPNGFIDDAYNANPAGFRSALSVLRAFPGRRVLVTPGMVELGERQDALNRELGAFAAACCDDAILVGERQAPPLREGLLSAGFPAERIHVVPTLSEGLSLLPTLPDDGGRTVLLENDLPDNF